MRDEDTIFLEKAYHDMSSDAYDPPEVIIDGLSVDLDTLVLKGLDPDEHPIYEDAYPSYAEFTNGKTLTCEELHELSLTETFREYVIANAFDILHND